jgi:hypothetical protein
MIEIILRTILTTKTSKDHSLNQVSGRIHKEITEEHHPELLPEEHITQDQYQEVQ